MSAVTNEGDFLPVTDSERGAAIRRRRVAEGFSLRQFAEKSGVSREAITAAEKGEARGDTYFRLETFLDAWDHEVGNDMPDPPRLETIKVTIEEAGQKITFEVTVPGPIDDPEELRRLTAGIMRGVRDSKPL